MNQSVVKMAAIAKIGHTSKQPSISQGLTRQIQEQALISQTFALLLQNWQITRKIAAKVGIKLGDYTIPTGPNPFSLNQHLILHNRVILIKIANKLGTMVPILPKSEGQDGITQDYLMLLGNRRIVKAIGLQLNLEMPPLSPLIGTIYEQNCQLVAATHSMLEAILVQVEARMPK
jgi:hypothetical protein